MLKTKLTEYLNIVHPIVQAPIGSLTSPELVAAVSNAGGLGMLALSWTSAKDISGIIEQTQKLTPQPFGVNLCLETEQHERIDACLQAGVKIFSLFWGSPAPYIAKLKAANATLLHTVANAEETQAVCDLGVDILVAQGYEAGGHVWGKVSTMALLPRVVDHAQGKPVIAAGGISDGRGLAAALALGADGVWMGTRFAASTEALAHPGYKQHLIDAQETDTVYSCLFDGGWPDAPHRTLRNSTVRQWENLNCPNPKTIPKPERPIATLPSGVPVFYRDDWPPVTGMTGDWESGALYAGQGIGLIKDIKPAAQIVEEVIDKAKTSLQSLYKFTLTCNPASTKG